MKRSHYKITPFKILKEVISLNPIELYRVIFGSKFHYYNYQESLKQIIKGKSFIRWGDGETALARGKDIWFQSSQPPISSELMRLWNTENEEVVLCLPRTMLNGTIFQYIRRRHDFWKEFSSRIFFAKRKNLLKSRIFGDTYIWYDSFNIFLEDLRNVLASRSILLVASDVNFFENLKSRNFDVDFLQIREREIFSDLSKIEISILTWLRMPRIKPTIVLLAAGPIGKILAFRNSSEGQFVDIGHGFLLNLGDEIIIVKE